MLHRWIARFCIASALVFVFTPLLTGCAAPDPGRLVPVPARCARPSLPLTIAFTDEGEDMRTEFLAAGEEWQEALGAPVFVETSSATPDVLVTFGPAPAGKAYASSTATTCTTNYLRSVVTFHRGMDVTEAHAYALHEVGHVLGLRDSTNPASVMDPNITDSLMGNWADPPDFDDLADICPHGSVRIIQRADVLTLKVAYRVPS